MKLTLLILGFLSLTACSSLITRGDLKDCQTQCKEKGSCMSHVSKHEGQLQCECELTKAEKEAIDKEIKDLSVEMDKMDKALDEVKPVEIPATEQEIVPAAGELVIPEQTPKVEETPITVEEIKMEAPKVEAPAPTVEQK